jgi:hypothetical protein
MLARSLLIPFVLAVLSPSAYGQYGYETTTTQPVLAAARINDQGQLVVRQIIAEGAYEKKTKTVPITKMVEERRTKVVKTIQDGKEVDVEVPFTVQVPVTVQETIEVVVIKAVPVEKQFVYSLDAQTKEYHAEKGGPSAAFYETNGQEVPAANIAARLVDWQPIVVSSNGAVVPDYYTYVFQPGTLVAALPKPVPKVVAPMGAPVPQPLPQAPQVPTESVPKPKAASAEKTESTYAVAFQQEEKQETPKGLPPRFAFAKITNQEGGSKLLSLRTIAERTTTQKASYTVEVPNANDEAPTELREIEMQHVIRTHDIWQFHGLGPVKAMTGDGQKIGWQDLPARLPRETTVLIMTGGRKADEFWFKTLRPDTLTLSTPIPDESLFQSGYGYSSGQHHRLHAPMPPQEHAPPANGPATRPSA